MDQRSTLGNLVWLRQCWCGLRQAASGVKLSMLVGFCALVLRSEFPQVNTAPVTHPCGRALFVTAGCNAEVSDTLIFVLAVPVFESALVSYSLTVVHHHVVLANVALLTMFAPSLDYHISIGETPDRIISPRWQPECLSALLSLPRTACDTV